MATFKTYNSKQLLPVLCLYFVLLLQSTAFGQNNTVIDSLNLILQTAKEDTNKVRILNELCIKFIDKGTEKALDYANKALLLAENIKYETGKADALNIIGNIYQDSDDYEKAMDCFQKALIIYQEQNNLKGIGDSYHNIGNIHRRQGNNPSALEHFLKALKIRETIDNKFGIASTLNSIGNIYISRVTGDTMNTSLALEYYSKALTILKDIGNDKGIASATHNIGNIYLSRGDDDKAIDFYMQSLMTYQKIGDDRSIGSVYNDIGGAYNEQGNLTKAIEYNNKAYSTSVKLNDKSGMVIYLLNGGGLYTQLGNYTKAYESIDKGIQLAKEIGAKDYIKEGYAFYAEGYEAAGNSAQALHYFKQYMAMKDTLFNEESQKQIAEMQTKYETEKKEQQITLLNKDKALQEEQLNRQRIFISAIAGGLLLMIALAIISYRSFLQKKRANELLTEKNNTIEKQRIHIIDSINYAKRIQEAMLMREEEVHNLLPFETFILNKPKDIVGGDFYWFSRHGSRYFLAAVDCTGHGVPGGFMSMLGNAFLNEIVNEKKIFEPGEILNQLNLLIVQTLREDQEESTSQDGMDMALCSINLDSKTIEFAGAGNPMLIVANGTVSAIKGEPYSIGGKMRKKFREKPKTFTTRTLPLEDVKALYLYSDGMVDQFGGAPESKKFGSSQFRDLIFSISGDKATQQKTIIDRRMTEWMAGNKQIDDMLLIGVKFPFNNA